MAGKDGKNHVERLTGDTIDISEWTEFGFMIYSGIGTSRPITQKERLKDRLEFHIG